MDFQFLLLESAAKVGGGDFVSRLELLHTLVLSDVDEYAARHQWPDVFNAELRQSLGLREIVTIIAIVEKVADAEMPETIELGADLAKFAADEFVVIHGLVAAGNLECLWDAQTVMPGSKHRHSRFVNSAQLIDGTARDQVFRLQDFCRRHPVRSASLIVGAPTRWVPSIRLAAHRGSPENDRSNNDYCEHDRGNPCPSLP